MLGMPWHTSEKPSVDYSLRTVTVGAIKVSTCPISSSVEVETSNLRVKKFRSLNQRRGHRKSFQIFQVVENKENNRKNDGKEGSKTDRDLERLQKKLCGDFSRESTIGALTQ